MATSMKKATFNLHVDVLEAIDKAVAEGAAPSKNALVEQALKRELKELRHKEQQTRWEVAMRDPLFLRDVEEVEIAFRSADAETARGIK